MKNKNFPRKLFAVVIISAQIFSLPFFAFAQLGVSTVPVNDTANGTGGISGTVANTAASAAFASAEAANKACDTTELAYFKTDSVTQMAFGGLELIGGGKALLAQLEAKNKAIEGFITCRTGVLTTVKAIIAPNTYTVGQKQNLINDITAAISSLKAKQEPVKQQMNLARQGFWKSIVLQILIKTTKTVTTRLVNDLTSQYKINDVMRYTDAVASQVYTNQLIRDQSTSGTEQLILRSMLTNPILKEKVHSAVYQAAADALEVNGSVFNARSLDPKDPDFYLKLSKYGLGETNPQFMEKVYENRAAEMDKIGKSMAANEILVGSGLKSPRNCAGNVSQQQAIDQQWQLANDKMQNRLSLYKELKEAYDKQYASLSAKDQQQLVKDLDRAQADYLKAATELRTTPDKFESPVLEVCKYIASPAEMINKGIDKAFDKYTDHLSQYNDGNLPFFMNLISDIGANISQSLIFGGNPKAVLLDESRNISTAANLGLSFMDSKVSEQNLSNGVQFEYTGSGGSYTLSWRNLSVEDASYMTITGPGASNVQLDSAGRPVIDTATGQPKINKLGTIGSLEVNAPSGGTYSLQIYDSQNRKLGNTSTITIPNPNSAVRGAVIESPRGPRGGSVTMVEGLR